MGNNFNTIISENIKEISTKIETMPLKYPKLGLRDGLIGRALFFFYYAHYSKNSRYYELANSLINEVLNKVPENASFFFAPEFSEIGRTIDFLAKESFLEVDFNEFKSYFEEPLILSLRQNEGIDFGYSTGIIGICDFFVNRNKQEEALSITISRLCSGLRVAGYRELSIEPLFLFPSDVLRDVKIFLFKLNRNEILYSQKKLLNESINSFESQGCILRSNCPEYTVLQDLREAGIIGDRQKIQSLLDIVAKTSSDLICKGLASLSLIDKSLPEWWKLF
ncbi:MAG: hypothetical protein JXR53_07900 [Bacteroidales bacterium]|nr:hypothetical protein [Bacteroidales bacterium]